MWLVRGPVTDDVFLIPADRILGDRPLIDGIPDLTTLGFGGNFAYSHHPMFASLTGSHTAVGVHDRTRP
jgi:hypothetical protein